MKSKFELALDLELDLEWALELDLDVVDVELDLDVDKEWNWINAVKTIQQKTAAYLAVCRRLSIVCLGPTGFIPATTPASFAWLANSIFHKFSNVATRCSSTDAFSNAVSPVQKCCAMGLD